MSELTPSDVRLLDGLLTHRALTTAQAARVAALPLRTANYRLNRLRRLALTDRVRPFATSGSAPLHWWLTTAGRRRLGVPGRTRAGWTSPLFLAHTVATAAVPLALAEHGPSVGLRLLTWRRDAEAWEPFSDVHGRTRITPDGHALVHVVAEDAAVPLMVEIDRATMPLTRLAEKIERYLRYTAKGTWTERHPMCPVLLVLTTCTTRAVNTLDIAADTRRHDRAFGPTGELLIASAGQVGNADDAVTGRVWRSHHQSAPAEHRTRVQTLTEVLRYRISTERSGVLRSIPPWERHDIETLGLRW